MRFIHEIGAAIALAALLALGACKAVLPSPDPPGDPSRYDLVFEGARHYSDEELLSLIRPNLEVFAESDYGKPAIDDAAYAIETRMRRDGFPFARVDYEYEREGNHVRVRFVAEQGARIELGKLVFTGSEQVERSRVASFFEDKELLGLRTEDQKWFVREVLESRTGALVQSFRAAGHLRFRAEIDDVAFDYDRKLADVTVHIEAGPQFYLDASSVSLTGELLYPQAEIEASFSDLLEPTPELHGHRPYVPRLAFEIRGRIEGFLGKFGHADALVVTTRKLDEETGYVQLSYALTPGPIVKITEIRISGEHQTSEDFLRSRLAVEAGDTYTPEGIQDSFRDLYASGLFRTVDVKLEKVEGNERAVLVSVEELPSLEFYIEPGLGSYEGPRMRVGATERNLYGTGLILHSDALVSARALEAELGITNPWFLDTPWVADASIGYQRREEPSFEVEEQGILVSFVRAWEEQDLQLRLAYEFRNSDLLDVDVANEDLDVEDELDIATVSLSPTWDTRNRLFLPNAGQETSLSLDFADGSLASDIDFFRVGTSHSNYHALSDELTLAMAARLGLIIPRGDTDEIPIQERFFNGGEFTVRSFKEDQLGPESSNGEPLGGEAFSFASVELRQRLTSNLHLAIFGDVGTVAVEHEKLFEFDDPGYAVGLGLRYLLPIGPIRLDGAWNPDREDDQDRFVWHFTIGLSF